jgi:2-pyrone-4,6-dicarboxylate lactonase
MLEMGAYFFASSLAGHSRLSHISTLDMAERVGRSGNRFDPAEMPGLHSADRGAPSPRCCVLQGLLQCCANAPRRGCPQRTSHSSSGVYRRAAYAWWTPPSIRSDLICGWRRNCLALFLGVGLFRRCVIEFRAIAVDQDYLPFQTSPSRPKYSVPLHAVDAHCHVFGPAALFPFAPSRKYTPCDASKEQLFSLRDFLGFEKNVIVQATCHGSDNRAMEDALVAARGRARGIAVVEADISNDDLQHLDALGVRGVRFNFLRRLVDTSPRDQFLQIARRIADFGWHVVVYFEGPDLGDLQPFLTSLPTDVIIDHMGRPNVSKGVDGSEFSKFLRLMENRKFWVKVSCPERLTIAGPPYADVVPFARRLVETYSDRVLWGTDWPHPNMTSHMPDDGQLVDFIPEIASSGKFVEQLLVDNPTRLYWSH